MQSATKLVFAASVLALAACQPAGPAASDGSRAEAAAPAAAPPELKLTCTGPFGPATTGAELVRMFGAENVADESSPGMDGETLRITAVYPKDPRRRIEITFADPDKREKLVNAEIKSLESQWYGPEDIQMAENIQVVETANGGPFELQGFGWDYGGYVTDWKGGKLASVVKDCKPLMRFSSDNNNDPAIIGEGTRLSSLPGMASAKVVSISVGWYQPPPN
jgi:hypothetical protein